MSFQCIIFICFVFAFDKAINDSIFCLLLFLPFYLFITDPYFRKKKVQKKEQPEPDTIRHREQ